MRYVTWDLDSTLCDTRHRQGKLIGGAEFKGEYTPEIAAAYAQTCGEDKPIESALWLARRFIVLGYGIGIVSARPRVVAHQTLDWLHRHALDIDFMELMTEHYDDHVKYKVETLVRLVDSGYQIDCHFDDWPSVRIGLEAVGIRCVILTPELADASGTLP